MSDLTPTLQPESGTAADSGNITRIEIGTRVILLLGTAHVSKESSEEVARLIESEKPDRICIELDKARYESIVNHSDFSRLDITKVFKEKRGFLLLANLVLASFQKRIGGEMQVQPGLEMIRAVDLAKEKGIPFSLCDRDVQITLRRAWMKSGLVQKSKMLAALIESAFASEKPSAEEIETLKNKSSIQTMMEELAAFLPKVKEVLIDERDQYLASRIWQAEGAKTLAVIGAGHASGVADWIGRYAAGTTTPAIEELESLPKPKIWGKLIGWIIPIIIVGLSVWGIYRVGWEDTLSRLLVWVLANGGLAAVGSIVALAHPLVILVALVSAPIATLNPLLAVGFFTGFAQAFLNKPRVSDFESLSTDIASVRGFYRNRVTRALLVFFFSSIGGMIGNFIGVPYLLGVLAR